MTDPRAEPTDPLTVAEAFSHHDFAVATARMAPQVRWVLPGQPTIEGRDAVEAACATATADMSPLTVEFSRFVSVASAGVAAVDVIATYTSPDGAVSRVSSADVYEFDPDGRLVTITSYAVELGT